MPSDFALKTMNRVHRTILAVSGGRLGWKADGMSVLELHTIGRTSGPVERRRHCSPAECVADARHQVIVAVPAAAMTSTRRGS